MNEPRACGLSHRLMDEPRARGSIHWLMNGPPADERAMGAQLEPLACPPPAAVGGLGAAERVGAPASAAGEAAPRRWRPALVSGSLPTAALAVPGRASARPGSGLEVAGECRHHITQRRRCSHLSSHAVSLWPTIETAVAGHVPIPQPRGLGLERCPAVVRPELQSIVPLGAEVGSAASANTKLFTSSSSSRGGRCLSPGWLQGR